MKDNLENILKDKLDKFEMPYDTSAWSSMEKRLDARAAANGARKWYWASGAVVIALLSSLLVYTWDGEIKKKDKEIADAIAIENSKKDHTSKISKDEILEENDLSNIQKNMDEEDNVIIEVVPEKVLHSDHVDAETTKNESKADHSNAQKTNTNSEEIDAKEKKNNKLDKSETKNTIDNNELASNFTHGSIENSRLCNGEELVVKNTTPNKKVKVEVNGKIIELLQNEQARFNNITSATFVNYLDENNEVIARDFIEVHSKPNIRFSAVANLHNLENGLPVIQISNINEDVLNMQWSLDGKVVALNNENEIYCHEAGNHSIKLEVEDAYGCRHTETAEVKVDVNYALRASNAGLYPFSNDFAKRTFMPPGLKKLGVGFTLMIIDPRSGSMVFETQDITEEWDGRDINTGNYVDFNQAYIWQVKLNRSIENFPTTYRGSVTVINGN